MKKCLPVLLLLYLAGSVSLAAQAPDRSSVAAISADRAGSLSTAEPQAVPEGASVQMSPPALVLTPPSLGGIVSGRSGDLSDPSADAADPSILRHIAWGSLAGASAGLLTSALVLNWCDAYCEGSETAGVMLHVGIGAVAGAVVGAMVRELRR